MGYLLEDKPVGHNIAHPIVLEAVEDAYSHLGRPVTIREVAGMSYGIPTARMPRSPLEYGISGFTGGNTPFSFPDRLRNILKKLVKKGEVEEIHVGRRIFYSPTNPISKEIYIGRLAESGMKPTREDFDFVKGSINQGESLTDVIARQYSQQDKVARTRTIRHNLRKYHYAWGQSEPNPYQVETHLTAEQLEDLMDLPPKKRDETARRKMRAKALRWIGRLEEWKSEATSEDEKQRRQKQIDKYEEDIKRLSDELV